MMTADDLATLSGAPPGERIAYGDDPLQYAELLLPEEPGPHPVVANIHGGVWMAQYTIEHSRAQARALAASGFAVWNIEYRRVGDAGGGWPGTFRDVSNALDHLRHVATSLPAGSGPRMHHGPFGGRPACSLGHRAESYAAR